MDTIYTTNSSNAGIEIYAPSKEQLELIKQIANQRCVEMLVSNNGPNWVLRLWNYHPETGQYLISKIKVLGLSWSEITVKDKEVAKNEGRQKVAKVARFNPRRIAKEKVS